MDDSNNLQSKAEVVEALILQSAEIPVQFASNVSEVGRPVAEAIRIETMALLLRMTEEIAQRDLYRSADFMLLVFERLVARIASSTDSTSALDTLVERFDYYGTLLVWIAPTYQAQKGTLLWEYSARVTQLAALEKNAAFSVGLSSLLMASFRRWDLKLLFSAAET
jgi:hypothetical protein